MVEEPLVALTKGMFRPNTPVMFGTNTNEGSTFLYAGGMLSFWVLLRFSSTAVTVDALPYFVGELGIWAVFGFNSTVSQKVIEFYNVRNLIH